MKDKTRTGGTHNGVIVEKWNDISHSHSLAETYAVGRDFENQLPCSPIDW